MGIKIPRSIKICNVLNLKYKHEKNGVYSPGNCLPKYQRRISLSDLKRIRDWLDYVIKFIEFNDTLKNNHEKYEKERVNNECL